MASNHEIEGSTPSVPANFISQMTKRNRRINPKGQDVLAWIESRETEEAKKERQRIADLCQAFYSALLFANPSTKTDPSLSVLPEHHVLTGPGGRSGLAAYIPSTNEIIVTLRLKHEAAGSFEEAVELCLESVAHEYWHYSNGTKIQNDEDERKAEVYARGTVQRFLRTGMV